MGDYVRGFARASRLSASDLAAVYFTLAIEQAENASIVKGTVLTLELWISLARAAWQSTRGS